MERNENQTNGFQNSASGKSATPLVMQHTFTSAVPSICIGEMRVDINTNFTEGDLCLPLFLWLLVPLQIGHLCPQSFVDIKLGGHNGCKTSHGSMKVFLTPQVGSEIELIKTYKCQTNTYERKIHLRVFHPERGKCKDQMQRQHTTDAAAPKETHGRVQNHLKRLQHPQLQNHE